ncbi:MAG: response regulator [Desulfobacterales bacterium]|nr:MAG: response regulator [Desulfobacterales bacterium]
MKILLVDDEEELVSTLALRLGLRDITADWTSNPQKAEDMVAQNQYQVAILDVKMPGINGFELKQRLEQKDPALKFIFMTGHGSENYYRQGCSETGEAYYLVKPVDITRLMEKINEVIDGN